MRKFSTVAIAMLAFAALTVLSKAAEPFGPMFTVVTINGECHVQVPETEEFTPAEPGKSYPYGTKLKTGRNSSVIVEFSKDNVFRVLANASLEITQDVKHKKLKTIRLTTGKLEVALHDGFQLNDALNIETPTAICGALECEYTVETGIQDEFDLFASVYTCTEGAISVFGPHFDIPRLDAGDAVSVSSTEDGMRTMIKCVSGTFDIAFTDEFGNPKTVTMQPGMVAKIMRSYSSTDGSLTVTVLIVELETGAILESFNVQDITPEAGQEVNLPAMEEDEETTFGDEEDDGWISTTTTTTSTTTTTTARPNAVDEMDQETRTTTTTTTVRTSAPDAPTPTPVGPR